MLFPAGYIINAKNINIEKLSLYQKAWQLELVQIEKGISRSNISAVHTPNIQLGLSINSKGMIIQGAFPYGARLLYTIDSSNSITINNEIRTTQELHISSHKSELDVIFTGCSSSYTIAVGEKLIQESFYQYYGVEIDDYLQDNRLYIKPEKLLFFYAGLKKWIDYLNNKEDIKISYYDIEHAILRHIYHCITFKKEKKQRNKFQVSKLRDFLHNNIMNPIKILDISQELNMSERQLHASFKQTYGISPKKYLQNIRLNKIRATLLTKQEKNISDIAFQYNFTHMSLFSNVYKKMFQELPSETLQR